jgi:hypothetical protein
MSTKKVSVAEIAFANIMILVMIYTLENIWLMRHESTRTIVYEKIDLIKPENYSLLLQDLRERTGLNVHRAEIKNTDFQTDTARITIFYYLEKVNEN